MAAALRRRLTADNQQLRRISWLTCFSQVDVQKEHSVGHDRGEPHTGQGDWDRRGTDTGRAVPWPWRLLMLLPRY